MELSFEIPKLIVNYLPPYFNDGHLHEILRWHHGYRRCNVVRAWHSGRSLGYGFAEFATVEDARNCANYFVMAGNMFGCQSGGQLRVGDKKIKFSLANPQSGEYQDTKVLVSSIPLTWKADDLRRFFHHCGPIKEINVVEARASAYVYFVCHNSAQMAVDLSRQIRSFSVGNAPAVNVQLIVVRAD